MSKYDPLYRHLVGQPAGPVTLTFAQIETILGFKLPASARKRNEWWGNEVGTTRHVQLHSWRNARRTVAVDLKKCTATFT